MPELPEFLEPSPETLELLSPEHLGKYVAALAVLVIGMLAARFVGRAVRRVASLRLGEAQGQLVGRFVFYLLFAVVAFEALHTAGLDLGVLLGAAGILTVALGFAAQTSASNLISGLFLMAEKPFLIGDTVRVGSTLGIVVSIDLLSVRLRTFDNLLVRLPNEGLLKSEITNLTRHPIRRVDLDVGIAYSEDPERAKQVLEALADANELVLDEPRPQFFFLGFGDSALQLRFGVWTATENWLDLKNRFLMEIKHAFDEHGIEFPFPQRTLSTLGPLPVRLEPHEDGGDEETEEDAP